MIKTRLSRSAQIVSLGAAIALAAPALAMQDAPAAAPLLSLKASAAKIRGDIKLVGDALVSSNSELLTEESKNDAIFDLASAQGGPADIYFRIRTASAKQDSWFVDLNGRKTVLNNWISGSEPGWVKVMSAKLNRGSNKLTVAARESGAALLEVAVMKPGEVPGLLVPPMKH